MVGIILYIVISLIAALLQMAPSYILASWVTMDLEGQQKATDLARWFVISIALYMVVVFFRSVFLQLLMLQSSTGMHNTMAEKVLRSNIIFFDSNPIGRITTRFSRDLTVIDMMLPPITILVTQGILRAITVAITVSIVIPYLLVVVFLGASYMWYVAKMGIPPMIDSQRLDNVFFGPINTTFTTVVNGLVTLRGYRQFGHFKDNFLESIEKSANASFCYVHTNRWVGIRLDTVCMVFGVTTAAFAVFMKNTIDRELLTFSL
jgi:ATP-binding cassette subfamily C (CFTR/MRP) protein 4